MLQAMPPNPKLTSNSYSQLANHELLTSCVLTSDSKYSTGDAPHPEGRTSCARELVAIR